MLPFEKVQREVLIKKKADTSDKFGKNSDERTVQELLDYAIINLDKPKGPTSHQVSAYVQKIFNIKKSGHSGTLDPKVTGVLPTAIGRATRVVQHLLTSGKEYIVLMHLHKEIEENKIREIMNEFVGKIRQLPPIKSAVKRQWRSREIYYIDILEISEQDVLFRVGCQAGTYIRKLCSDIGDKLEIGAHMAELRRTQTGPFKEETLVTLHDCTDALHLWKEEGNEEYIRKVLLPIEKAVDHLPKIWVLDTTVDSLCNGANLHVPGIARLNSNIEINENVAVMTLKNELIGIGEAKMNSDQISNEEKGLALDIKKIFMLKGTYPKIEKC